MSALRIKKFDPSKIQESRIIFLLGKRHTGKSVLMKDLLYHMPRPDFVLAMAPTEDTLKMFREFLPEACIFDHFSQEKLERVVSVQRELVARGKKRTVLVLLDDCLYQKGVLKSNAMRHVFFNGRHDNISLMCCAQYMMEVDVALRTNIDYIFTMRENILANRQKLYKYYFGQFSKFEEFDKVMTACTQDYRSLVMDGTVSNTIDPLESVKWYKANINIPQFKMCKEIFWKWSGRYGLTEQEVRDAHRKQYEIESAVAESAQMKKTPTFTIVQIEDEHGDALKS